MNIATMLWRSVGVTRYEKLKKRGSITNVRTVQLKPKYNDQRIGAKHGTRSDLMVVFGKECRLPTVLDEPYNDDSSPAD